MEGVRVVYERECDRLEEEWRSGGAEKIREGNTFRLKDEVYVRED